VTRSNKYRDSPAIALFGGAFNPIHNGHLAVARAAVRRFRLATVYFIPTARPPHRPPETLALFAHRYAMVALACAGQPRFVPSLAEADPNQISYTIETVERFQRQLGGRVRLFLLLGADAFLQFRTWRRWQDLLSICECIVAHRPGFPLEKIREVVPADASSLSGRIHLLPTVASPISATTIRQYCAAGRPLRGLVPPAVADYLRKQALYR
jgi:nicotinate-nucleotide adenylyltransferase